MRLVLGPQKGYACEVMKRCGGIALILAGGCIALSSNLVAGIRSPSDMTLGNRPSRDRPDPEPADSDLPKFELSADNPYGAIVSRNIFDLHDPPPPAVKEDKAKEPPPNIKLTGITTIFGAKQAFFILNEPGAAGKQATTRTSILREGQREGVLQVVEIDTKARSARIMIEGNESLIHIETNKAAASGGPGPGPGGAPGHPNFVPAGGV